MNGSARAALQVKLGARRPPITTHMSPRFKKLHLTTQDKVHVLDAPSGSTSASSTATLDGRLSAQKRIPSGEGASMTRRAWSGALLAGSSVMLALGMYSWLPSATPIGERLIAVAYLALPGMWGGAFLMGGSGRASWGDHAHTSWLPPLSWGVLGIRRCLQVIGYALPPWADGALTGVVILLIAGFIWSWAHARKAHAPKVA